MNMSKYIKETNIKEECFQMYQQSNKYHKCMNYIDVKIYQRNKITYECLQMQLHNYGSRNPPLKAFHDSCLTTGVKKKHDSPLSKTHSRTVFLYKRWNIKMDPYYIHLYNMKYESRYGL